MPGSQDDGSGAWPPVQSGIGSVDDAALGMERGATSAAPGGEATSSQPGDAPTTPPGSGPGPGAGDWRPVDDRPEAWDHGVRAILMHVLFGLAAAFLVFNFLYGLYVGGVQIFTPDSQSAQDLKEALQIESPSALFWNVAFTFLLVGIIPTLWAFFTRRRPIEGGIRYLGLRPFGKPVLLGLGLAFIMVLAVLVASVLMVIATDGVDALTEDPSNETENPVVEGIVANLNIPLVLFISLAAGFGEEVLFRGILQKYTGWWIQGIIFGLNHAAGGDPFQIVVTTIIGLLFGWLVKRGHSLWLVIAAHFFYDLILLSIALLAPESV